ncbi:uncharacterized protein LOC134078686 [Sardina pilchardus]|uniref:uncharacterized protein LOC134078686 n=1 Tax=Sardina pilchardus TaxID=27697 RepID=UPI002E13FA74
MECTWILSVVYLMVAPAIIACNGVAEHTHNDPAPAEPVRQTRTEYFAEGKDADIRCSNRTWSNELFHFIWKINISGVYCLISESTKNPPHNNCTGGKVLRNTSKGESYLHIPHFGVQDEGTYKCEAVFRGEAEEVNVTVRAAVPPVLNTRVVWDDGQWFAVCSAQPVAKVSWEELWETSVVTERSTQNADGTITMESSLHVPDNRMKDKLTCVATSHPSWTGGGSSTTIDLTEIRIVPPVLNIRIEWDDGQWFAVCSAAGGKPAGKVSWEELWESSEVTERSTQNADGTLTMESWVRVPDDRTKDKLTCVASHPFWTQGGSPTTIDLAEIRFVPPVLNTRLEWAYGQWFAVCSAAGGKPAAKVSWEELLGSPEVTERSTQNADKSVTVESWVHLQNDDMMDELVCIVSHPLWTNKRSRVLELDAWMSSLGTALIIRTLICCTILFILVSAVILSNIAQCSHLLIVGIY